jgi:hypothetical protein
VLELAGVVYGPHLVPISTEVVKKRKEDAAEKLARRLKVHEKKRAGVVKVAAMVDKKRSETVKVVVVPEKRRTEIAKVTVTQSKGGFKWLSDKEIASTKSVKLSKNTVPHTIASATTLHITHEACGPKKCV